MLRKIYGEHSSNKRLEKINKLEWYLLERDNMKKRWIENDCWKKFSSEFHSSDIKLSNFLILLYLDWQKTIQNNNQPLAWSLYHFLWFEAKAFLWRFSVNLQQRVHQDTVSGRLIGVLKQIQHRIKSVSDEGIVGSIKTQR